MLSKRVRSISPSPTLAITAEAKKMKAQGIDVVGFGAGEPDFDTPDHIKEAAKKALDRGFTKYTPASGMRELKEAVCRKLKEENGLEYEPDQVLISCGAKHSIFNAILALCDEGDEVILPSPYWVSYPEMIKLAQAKPVIIKTTQENNFKITSQQLEEAISSKTKLFILNSPSNPTGMIYTKDELRIISDILTEARIYCISDEIYEKIIYDGWKHTSIASLNPRIKELTILVNGVSKTYSMTGWRIGYAAGPKEIIQAMSNLQSHSTSNPTSVSQVAAIAALQSSQGEIRRMVDEFQRRRDHIVKRLNRIPGISCLKPPGAFYAFPDISRIIGKSYNGKIIRDSISLAQLLLYEAKVAVVPGAAFGADEHLRFSYATSMENIDKGLDRVEEFVKKLP
ncbi:aspartate aminotransferase [Candidatus Aerophobetes bacterium]|uniref:Aminotransferase n=1 Tax=Aerophobetes bacterium TaxID=2030807 RepID=A0A497E5F5_UNCAE|nr:MAG: aspartate aminotransferase [Candidatus Aerophobetes bacterium]